jgi:hypothetical protein
VVGEVQSLFQCRENAEQAPAKPIDRSGAVCGEIGPLRSEHAQLGNHLFLELQLAQVTPHPRLIGSDHGVLGVGLALAAIRAGGAIHRDPGRNSSR